MGTEIDTSEWIHCNGCLRTTRHEIVASRVVVEPDFAQGDDFAFEWRTTYTLLECRGCGSVTLRRRIICDYASYNDTEFFPPAVSRRRPHWRSKLPSDLSALLDEIYVALNAGCYRLVVMGARSMVDLLMASTVGAEGTFAARLSRLVDEGFLSAKNRGIVESALDAGHAAVHRAYAPKRDEVGTVLDIVENLLQSVVLEKDAAQLSRKTPQRKRASRSDD
jgi:hypothetical protein